MQRSFRPKSGGEAANQVSPCFYFSGGKEIQVLKTQPGNISVIVVAVAIPPLPKPRKQILSLSPARPVSAQSMDSSDLLGTDQIALWAHENSFISYQKLFSLLVLPFPK